MGGRYGRGMSNAKNQLFAMRDDVAKMGSNDSVAWAVGAAFNASLAETKEAKPNNAALQAIEPVERGGSAGSVAFMQAGSFRVLVGQALAAYDDDPV